MDLALNNLQRLICHKTQQTKPNLIGAFSTITKGLLKGLEDMEVGGPVENIQMTALLRTARILRRVQET